MCRAWSSPALGFTIVCKRNSFASFAIQFVSCEDSIIFFNILLCLNRYNNCRCAIGCYNITNRILAILQFIGLLYMLGGLCLTCNLYYFQSLDII